MNIKMKVKGNKYLKGQIGLLNLLVSKKQQSYKLKNVNIQTINIDKEENYYKVSNQNYITKNLKQIKYLNSSSLNYNLNANNYLDNDEQISFFDSNGSDRVPSPINSLNSSSYLIYSKKGRKKRGHMKTNKNFFSNNSSFLNSSFSSSEENDYSESLNDSFKNRDNKRKEFYNKMMVEDNELDYLKRTEVGLIPSEDDENNSFENSLTVEENFNTEIERILIDIYNSNISLISSKNENDRNKKKYDLEEVERQIKKFLVQENTKTNLLILKCLSTKIKELVEKYREKVFEIEEIKNKFQEYQIRQQLIFNNQLHNNNSVGSNVATNSNSSFDSYINDETLSLCLHDEPNERGVTHVLLRELINIKRTLKVSAKEIERIFKYPLSILKNENGNKIKFSIEYMQNEEFCRILLKDEFISKLLSKIKNFAYQINLPKIRKYLEELEENCYQKNEMTKFVNFLNENLGITKEENLNKEGQNDNNQNLEGEINKKNLDKENKVSEKGKKNKKKKQNNVNNNNNEQNEEKEKEEIKFEDLDELLNYINDEKDSAKKTKKKGKRGKKNKKEKSENIQKEGKKFDIQDKTNDYLLDDQFLKEFEQFKNDIEKESIKSSYTKKIIPKLSNDFLKSISIY